MKRKTKIVCTLGPATMTTETISTLLTAGMNVARFNFSHGDHSFHLKLLQSLRDASAQTGIPVASLMDTKGPEIRTGQVRDHQPITLVQGNRITLTTEPIDGTAARLSISYMKLPDEIRIGAHILIADGLIDLEVVAVENREIHCLIRNGGTIGARKNVNVVGIRTSLPAVTEKDKDDLRFAAQNGFDFIAASFVRKPSDIMEIRSTLERHLPADGILPLIIAKIEDEEGVSNIDEIIRVSDGVMVARGDLGVQVASYKIPIIQKEIIHKCNRANKMVITATQMLDSMIRNPQPTRAEVADVANAMLDGTDAVMLSGETASGAYPEKAVQMMAHIAMETDYSAYSHLSEALREKRKLPMANTIARSAVLTAADIGAQAIISPTLHGNSPRLISQYRPEQPIVAVTPFAHVQRRLLLNYGVYPVITRIENNSDEMVTHAINAALAQELVQPFNKVVIAASIPIRSPIMLNSVRVQILADVVCKGQRGYGDTVCGTVCKAASVAEARQKVAAAKNPILVTAFLDEPFYELLPLLAGYVLEAFSSEPIDKIRQFNPEIIAIAGAHNAMSLLADGQTVTLDGAEKLVLIDKYDGAAV